MAACKPVHSGVGRRHVSRRLRPGPRLRHVGCDCRTRHELPRIPAGRQPRLLNPGEPLWGTPHPVAGVVETDVQIRRPRQPKYRKRRTATQEWLGLGNPSAKTPGISTATAGYGCGSRCGRRRQKMGRLRHGLKFPVAVGSQRADLQTFANWATALGRPLPTADVGYPVAHLGGQLSGG